jgi:hypothetical protein
MLDSYIEMSQGNSLYNILKQTKNVIFFFFYKISEQGGRTGPVWEKLVPMREESMWRKGVGG